MAIGLFLTLAAVAGATGWTVVPNPPVEHRAGQETAKVILAVNYALDLNGVLEGDGQTAVRDDIGGIAADLTYDPTCFACPRIEPAVETPALGSHPKAFSN